MCTKRTPLRTRLFCSCSHVLLAGTLVVMALVVAFAWTHLLLVLGVAGLVVAGTAAAVWWLMRFAQPVIQHPAPEKAAEAPSVADVVAGFEAVTEAAVHEPPAVRRLRVPYVDEPLAPRPLDPGGR